MVFKSFGSLLRSVDSRTEDIKGEGGVRRYVPDQTYEGYTLFCRDWGDHFYLIDMEGNSVHSWDIRDTSIHFGELTREGHLLYSTADRTVEEMRGVHELDWEGNRVWYYPCPVDHDHRRMNHGNTLILCREEVIQPEIRDIWPDYRACYSPYIIEVNKDQEVVWEWHGKDHIRELEELAGIDFPRSDPERSRDWAHCNTASPLPKNKAGAKDPRFREGNIMFSYREIDTIGVIDKQSKEILWAWGPGVLLGQHMPQMLENGHILLFDNGYHSPAFEREYSRVLEIDPLREEILWEYKGDPPEGFYSRAVSGAQRLPNENTLICSGGQGRIFEVTKEKEVVWDYENPYRGPQGSNTLYRHSGRYPPQIIEPLLESK